VLSAGYGAGPGLETGEQLWRQQKMRPKRRVAAQIVLRTAQREVSEGVV
jgi:hypothetical protein